MRTKSPPTIATDGRDRPNNVQPCVRHPTAAISIPRQRAVRHDSTMLGAMFVLLGRSANADAHTQRRSYILPRLPSTLRRPSRRMGHDLRATLLRHPQQPERLRHLLSSPRPPLARDEQLLTLAHVHVRIKSYHIYSLKNTTSIAITSVFTGSAAACTALGKISYKTGPAVLRIRAGVASPIIALYQIG